MPTVEERASDVLAREYKPLQDRVIDNPLTKAIADHAISPDGLKLFSAQQLLIQKEFARVLGSLLADWPVDSKRDLDDRTELIENIAVEKTHTDMALRFATASDNDPDEVWSTPPLPSVKPSIDLYRDLARSPSLLERMAVIGVAVEGIAHHLYPGMVEGLRGYGYSDDDLALFIVHDEADEEHEDFARRVVDHLMEGAPEKELQPAVERGKSALTILADRLEGLHAAAAAC